MEKAPSALYSAVVCIGAGASGICLAAQLQTQLGLTDVHLYDRNAGVAGTWYANKYPGCACDVASHFYSFSFELNPYWSRASAPASEIRAYMERVAQKYDILRRTSLNTNVERAIYDDSAHRWTLHLHDLLTDRRYTHECRILVSAAGALSNRSVPKVPGMNEFEGVIGHTAEFDDYEKVDGRNVVVVGNGCTAAQLVPSIVKRTKTLTQIGRSPHWIFAPFDFSYSSTLQSAFRWIPGMMRTHRIQIWSATEASEPIFHFTPKGKEIRDLKEKQARAYIHRAAPEKYWDILIPRWEVGCKRRIIDNAGYIPSLHSSNLHLTASPLIALGPRSVKTADGNEYPADVILFATGFASGRTLDYIDIRGRGGVILKEHWNSFGGPEAYNTTAMHGFPNFFLLLGPNTITGYTSAIMAIENSVNYMINIIRPIVRGDADEVEVKDEAERDYSSETQAALKERIYVRCVNWYVEKTGWNSNAYPWSQKYFWYRCTFPVWSDWSINYVKPWWSRNYTKKIALYTLLLDGIVGLGVYGHLTRTPWWSWLIGSVQKSLRSS